MWPLSLCNPKTEPMPELIPLVNGLVVSASVDLNLTDLLRQQYSRLGVDPRRPSGYFFLTELVNLPQTYWKRRHPGVRKSPDLITRLAHGRKLHSVSRFWFSNLEGFELAEGTLNGFYVGVPDVSGRIDYRINGGIYEFKSKSAPDVSTDAITSTYVQDLEQLLFYSALSVNEPRSNSLVFLCEREGRRLFRAFKVEIRDFPGIRREMNRRVGLLRTALDSNGPPNLGRCHYTDGGCEFVAATCDCSTISERPRFTLGGSFVLTRDEDLETRLARIAEARPDPGAAFFAWDFMAPQRWYRERFEYALIDEPVDYEADALKEPSISVAEDCASRAGLFLRSAEARPLYDSGDPDIIASRKYARINTPGAPAPDTPVPCLVRFTNRSYVPNRPSDYHIAELGVVCSRAASQAGVVVMAHPYAPFPLSVYIVTFDIDRLRALFRDLKTSMRRAVTSGDPTSLLQCPEFQRSTCKFQACGCR